VAASRVRRAEDLYFTDRENLIKQIFSPLEKRGAGVKSNKKEPQTNIKKEQALPDKGIFQVYIKNYGSNTTTSSSKILINEHYIGTNNGFTVYKRNALLQELGFIKRKNHCQRNFLGLYNKKNMSMRL